MNLAQFQSLPTDQVARLVREDGPKVCVFPINGTRRWFMLEHADALIETEDPLGCYLDIMCQRHIELYREVFDHGIDTLLTPAFGPDLLERGPDYIALATEGLARLASHPSFLDFYRAEEVRVHFYGDLGYFSATDHAYLLDLFAAVTQATSHHARHRLFYGLFAHDATEAVVEFAVRFYQEQGTLATKRQVIEAYYGEYVEPVDFFVGFDKFAAFDMPLLATGSEDLYFTVAPSPYLTTSQLRSILYDHLYTRRGQEPDYEEMSPPDRELMRSFYQVNRDRTLGLGLEEKPGGIWYPAAQVSLPAEMGTVPGNARPSPAQTHSHHRPIPS